MKLAEYLKPKSIAFGFIFGFLSTLIMCELFEVFLGGMRWSEWTIRRLRENTAIEMHAEDIWRNKRSTLNSFDPLACTVSPLHHHWKNSWYEVTCTSENDTGKTWTYTALYGVRSSYFISWLPFVKDSRPVREMKQVNANGAPRGAGL
jgi:hypothetical protein